MKNFPGVRALAGVDFTLRAGEIHALMGENGAGKSTLVKVLTGVYTRDGGEVLIENQPVSPHSPREAELCGLSTVYQEVNLIPHLSVAENICLGREPTRWGCIRWKEVQERARAALRRLGVTLDVKQELASCSIAIQQLVALARALDIKARILVLDEPTSSLDDQEVKELFVILRRLRDDGMGIVFITHFLDQVYRISDRITILRDGKLVGEYETAALPRREMVGLMIGKTAEQVEALERKRHTEPPPTGEPFLAARGIARTGSLESANLSVYKGQVLGLAGLLGSGRTETARLLFGVDRCTAGEIKLNGETVSLTSPRVAIGHGIAMTPEDRKDAGIVPDLSVRENIVLALQGRMGFFRLLSSKRQRELADHYIQALGIKTPSPEQPIKLLSGGNQQKALLARWLITEPQLLILDEPTRGIDVGAKAEIEKLMDGLRAKGLALIFISAELEEVARDSQRVIVLRDRRVVGELSGDEISLDAVLNAISESAEVSS